MCVLGLFSKQVNEAFNRRTPCFFQGIKEESNVFNNCLYSSFTFLYNSSFKTTSFFPPYFEKIISFNKISKEGCISLQANGVPVAMFFPGYGS